MDIADHLLNAPFSIYEFFFSTKLNYKHKGRRARARSTSQVCSGAGWGPWPGHELRAMSNNVDVDNHVM